MEGDVLSRRHGRYVGTVPCLPYITSLEAGQIRLEQVESVGRSECIEIYGLAS
jgi:hypothetical protein